MDNQHEVWKPVLSEVIFDLFGPKSMIEMLVGYVPSILLNFDEVVIVINDLIRRPLPEGVLRVSCKEYQSATFVSLTGPPEVLQVLWDFMSGKERLMRSTD